MSPDLERANLERPDLDDPAFDAALVTAAFELAGEVGWMRVTAAGAARRAGLRLDRARGRFASAHAILAGFGRLADQAALAGEPEPEAPVRDQLFDRLMRRMDVLQAHRAGVLALARVLPLNPFLAAMLAADSLRGMAWLLEAVGLDATGPRGMLRAKGLLAVWLWTVRAWKDDESADLSATMSALDRALDRAEQAEAWLDRRGAPVGATSEAAADAAPVDEPAATLLPDAAGPGLPSTSPPPPD